VFAPPYIHAAVSVCALAGEADASLCEVLDPPMRSSCAARQGFIRAGVTARARGGRVVAERLRATHHRTVEGPPRSGRAVALWLLALPPKSRAAVARALPASTVLDARAESGFAHKNARHADTVARWFTLSAQRAGRVPRAQTLNALVSGLACGRWSGDDDALRLERALRVHGVLAASVEAAQAIAGRG